MKNYKNPRIEGKKGYVILYFIVMEVDHQYINRKWARSTHYVHSKHREKISFTMKYVYNLELEE